MAGVTTSYQTGVHGSRPAANAGCILYSCTTHGLVYRSDGTTWTTWLTLPSGSSSATPALTLGTAAAAGAAATFVATDATLPIFNASAPSTQAFGDAASAGAVNFAERQGHKHAMPAAPSGGTPVLLLDYALAADITNQAITAATYFDMFANQNFTKAAAGSLIEVTVRGMCFFNDNVANEYITRVNIDSGGTPVLKYIGAASDPYATSPVNSRGNPLAGGSVYISGLSAATHTIKVQITCSSSNDHLYCRASTNGPPNNGEFLHVQVIEHL